ncbi:hypothetical protein [Leptospira kmetyi]|uniref:hypothetical protein n=1 Tax=Leptospira kmetyi TaxID=408139 RepID=UPI000287A6F0|nr:hypothetical protein [Leptospira kmetyi]EQA55366.1 hypothetical protein LEP1GSC052_0048 [Leptospira kmetyi serovar Malaysia str. Bejo-Iso9]
MSIGFGGDLNLNAEDYEYHDLSQRIYPELEKANSPLPSWGTFIHPDEIRRLLFYGNEPLMTTRGSQLEDYQIKNWVDQAVKAFAQEISWDIYPRLWRSRPIAGQKGRFDLDPVQGQIETYAEWDDTYDYDSSKSTNFFLKLRNKNLCRVHRWVLTYPYSGSTILELTDRATIKHRAGLLQAVFTRAPFGSLGPPVTGIQGWRAMNQSANLPGAFQVDYSTGYDHASRVPRELKEQCLKYFMICILSSYAEGIVGGLSSYSTNVGVISESMSLSLSAENSFFGARIKQFTGELKEWWKTGKLRYSGVSFGALG